MDIKRQMLSAADAVEVDMVEYLSNLGIQPEKINQQEYWYSSPFSEQKRIWFWVDRRLNRWFDSGLKKGGDIIEFGERFFGISTGEMLTRLLPNLALQRTMISPLKAQAPGNKLVTVLRELPLTSKVLFQYLDRQEIHPEIARIFCVEVIYECDGKPFRGIALRNISQGYKILTTTSKLSAGPQDISLVSKGSKQVLVFEDLLDFLSFKTIHRSQPLAQYDAVILHSLSLFESTRNLLKKYDAVHLYLPRSNAGMRCSKRIISEEIRYEDHSELYRNYYNLHNWLMNFGNPIF